MLRIHFSTEDLLRVRVQAEPDVMWEILLSSHMAQERHASRVFGPWRHALRSGPPASSAGLLRTLSRPSGYSPDFLTPPSGATDLETGLDLVMSTPRTRLRADMGHLTRQTGLPRWASDVAVGEPKMMRRLGDALRTYYARALQPYWTNIRDHVRADRHKRMEAMADKGLEHLFQTLHTMVRWTAPVLEVDYPVQQDLHLEGRGLTLVPSVFCWPGPITLLVQSGTPVLIYPVEQSPAWLWTAPGEHAGQDGPAESLIALLGQTRAEVLHAIRETDQVNTTDLARTLGISLAGASQHASILRNAGLVVTARRKGSAMHQITDRGAALLSRAAPQLAIPDSHQRRHSTRARGEQFVRSCTLKE